MTDCHANVCRTSLKRVFSGRQAGDTEGPFRGDHPLEDFISEAGGWWAASSIRHKLSASRTTSVPVSRDQTVKNQCECGSLASYPQSVLCLKTMVIE
ncbi:MAG: hypothetical protein ACLR0U_12745 [Enterocloster clostridioformis]